MIINPYVFVGVSPGSYDTDAQAMFDKRLAVSDEPAAAYKQAISDYVVALKAVSGLWDDIIQLVVLAGATTVDGARQSIKGPDLLNRGFADADIGLKTGSDSNGTKFWDTTYDGIPAGASQNDFHMYGYFPRLLAGAGALLGAGGTASGSFRMLMANSRMVSGNNDTYTINTAGSHGLNRIAGSWYQRLINNGTLNTVTRNSQAPTAASFFLQANGGTADNSITIGNSQCLIFATGAGITTLGDYITPANDFVTALNAI